MSLSLQAECARTGCEATAEIDLDTFELAGDQAWIAGLLKDLQGWGFDWAGIDGGVFHCPEHRDV